MLTRILGLTGLVLPRALRALRALRARTLTHVEGLPAYTDAMRKRNEKLNGIEESNLIAEDPEVTAMQQNGFSVHFNRNKTIEQYDNYIEAFKEGDKEVRQQFKYKKKPNEKIKPIALKLNSYLDPDNEAPGSFQHEKKVRKSNCYRATALLQQTQLLERSKANGRR